jgi:hypothetical protein
MRATPPTLSAPHAPRSGRVDPTSEAKAAASDMIKDLVRHAGWLARCLGACALFPICAMPASAQTLQFAAHRDYSSGYGSASIAVGDVTGDTVPDLVTANYFHGTISVLPGNADGTFQPPRVLFLGPNNNPRSVAIGDFNRDGKLDVAAANPGANTVTILPGNGGGTFQPAIILAAGTSPTCAVVSDVSGDGRPDLVVANSGSNDVSVLLGNDDGTFQTARTFAADIGPAFVAVGDFNGDARPDLAVANTGSGTLSVLLGNGDGNFQPPQTFPAGAGVWSVAVADFNGDTRPDLAAANNVANTVAVLLGNGNGTFQAAQPFATSSPTAVVAGDFNRDGKADVATGSYRSSPAMGFYVSVLLGNGDGTLRTPQTLPVGFESWGISAGDFNGDGAPDLTVTNTFSTTVSVLLNAGDGTFPATPNYKVGRNPESIAVADFNQDGKLDQAVANAGSNTVSILPGNGNGTFQTALTFNAGRGPTSIAMGDFNRDGKLDLVVSNYGNADYYAPPSFVATTVSVLLGNGDGTFQAPQPFEAGSGPNAVIVGDFNSDGLQDLAVADYGIYPQRANTVSVLLGNGDGTFRAPQAFTVGNGAVGLVIGDFNRDNKQDLAVANYVDNTVSVLLGNGLGSFQSAGVFAVGAAPWMLVVSDLNGDLMPDLAVSDHSSDVVSVLLGNGDGTFRPHVWFRTDRNPTGLALADLNGDGKADLAVANYFSTTISVLLGNGDGTFQASREFGAGLAPIFVAIADFNGDGKLDLASANYFEGSVSVLLAGAAGPPPKVATPAFSPAAGTYTGSVSVTISDATSGATIRYTTDGTTPTTSSPIYTGPITVSQTTTIRAMATAGGMTDSAVASATYTIQQQVAAPTFSPAAGTYTGSVSVTISDATSGATIRYTTDGSTPTTSSPIYTAPISLTVTTTIRAIATASGMTNSAVASAIYTIQQQVATPTFNPAAGTYTGSVTVTISDATSGATIRYTTDGSAPTAASAVYTGPIAVSQTTTIRAMATASGMTDSAVASATYTVQQLMALTVTRTGAGSGTVTSSPAGIDCGSSCSASYASGTAVSLTAVAGSGSTFAGWSGGGCSGTGSCSLTLAANTIVTAGFATGGAVSPPILKWQYGGCFTGPYCDPGWYSSPAVADLEGDGQPDVIWGGYDLVALNGANGSLGWRAPSGDRIWPGVAVADLTGDGTAEVIVGRSSDKLTVYNRSGAAIWTRNPFGTGEVRTLAVADLENDGQLEIIVGSAGSSTFQLNAFEPNGTVRTGWPALHSGDPGGGGGLWNQNLAVADMNGDAFKEVFSPASSYNVIAVDRNGNQLGVNTMYAPRTVWSQIGMGVDQAVDLRGSANCGVEHRPDFGSSAPAIADVNGDGVPELIVVGNVTNCGTSPYTSLYHMPFILNLDHTRWSGSGFDWTVLPTPGIGSGPRSQDYNVIPTVQPNAVVADLDGDGLKEILFASYDGKVHAYGLDKSEHGHWPYTIPVSGAAGDDFRFASEPIVVDLNNDGRAEVIFTSWPKAATGAVGQVHILDYLGVELYRINLPAPDIGGTWNGALGAPTVANIDSDPDLELVVGTVASGVVAYELPNTANARVLWGTGRGNYQRTGDILPTTVPRTVRLTLATNPAGLQLKLDGQPVTTPFSFDSAVGSVRELEATTPQAPGGTTYDFVAWSDGGAARHTISTPAGDTTYTASYAVSGGGNPGLRAGYDFNAGTGTSVSDSSGNALTGAIAGGAAWTSSGRFGGALTFDGIDDYVTVAPSSLLNLTTGTVEAWVRLNTLGRWHGVVAKGNANHDPSHNYAVEITDGNLVTCVIGNGTSSNGVTSTAQVAAQQYYHLACAWDGSQLRLYIDGVLHRSVAQTIVPAANSSPLFIGQYGGNVDRLHGVIDEVRIYDVALGQAQIQSDMNMPVGTLPGNPTSPVRSNGQPTGTLAAWTTQVTLSLTTSESATCRYGPAAGVAYAALPNAFTTADGTAHAATVAGLINGASYTYFVRCQDGASNANPDDFQISFTVAQPDGLRAAYGFNDGTGTSVSDSSGNALTGAIAGGAAWTASGRFGGALTFDGIDDYVRVPSSSRLNVTTGTVEAWVRLDTLGRWHGVVAKGNANSDPRHNYAIEITDGNLVTCVIGNGSSSNAVTSTTQVAAQQFYHLACAWDGSQLRLYINGVLHRSAAQTIVPAANGSALFIGQYGGGVDRFDGVIDEVRIYDVALGEAQIQSNMTMPVGPGS